MSVELGTSRRASRDPSTDRDVDGGTAKVFDVLTTVAIVAGVASSLLVTSLTVRPRAASLAVGVGALVCGLVVSWMARSHLGRFHRARLTIHADHELVTTGPYGFIRHPLYCATMLVFVGLGALLGNWLGIAVLVALPLVAIVRRIRVEEAALLQQFGDEYRRIMADTARLVPFIW